MYTDMIDSNGNRWVVRGCDEEDGCVVIEKYVTVSPPADGFDKELDDLVRNIQGEKPRKIEEVPDNEPSEDMHIPADVVAFFVKTLVHEPGV